MGHNYSLAVSLFLPESLLISVTDDKLLKLIQAFSENFVKLSVVKNSSWFSYSSQFAACFRCFHTIWKQTNKHEETQKRVFKIRFLLTCPSFFLRSFLQHHDSNSDFRSTVYNVNALNDCRRQIFSLPKKHWILPWKYVDLNYWSVTSYIHSQTALHSNIE